MDSPFSINYQQFPPNYYPEHIYKKDEILEKLGLNANDYAKQIETKEQNYNHSYRKTLVEVLKEQYNNIANKDKALAQIEKLSLNNTFTVTTGQQIHIALGPFYVHNKILSVIEKAAKAQLELPNYNIVPIFWMATEDHDMDEIDWFTFLGKTYKWQHGFEGVSGAAPTSNIFNLIKESLSEKKIDDSKLELFETAYNSYSNLADATRYLINELYGNLGIVVIDANNLQLKSFFKQHILNDIISNSYQNAFSIAKEFLYKENLPISVNFRHTNFFYIKNNKRLRIDKNEGNYSTPNNEYNWSPEEIEKEINTHSHNFSPNVLFRPLYQEIILPNLAYIGGAAEFNYWLLITEIFKHAKIPCPIIDIRSSKIYISFKQFNKLWDKTIDPKNPFKTLNEHAKSAEEYLFGKNEFDDISEKLSQSITQGLGLLGKNRNKLTKKFKDISDAYLQQINRLAEENIQNMQKNPNKLAQLQGLISAQNEFFNTNKLWERRFFFIEYYMLTSESMSLFTINIQAPYLSINVN